jgi:hypothetical protein
MNQIQPFDIVARSYVPVDQNSKILPGIGLHYPVGLTCPFFSTRKTAKKYAAYVINIFGDRYHRLEPMQIENPFKFMEQAAGQGICGLARPNKGKGPFFLTFMLRVEEASHELPTVLTITDPSAWVWSLTRTKIRHFDQRQ